MRIPLVWERVSKMPPGDFSGIEREAMNPRANQHAGEESREATADQTEADEAGTVPDVSAHLLSEQGPGEFHPTVPPPWQQLWETLRPVWRAHRRSIVLIASLVLPLALAASSAWIPPELEAEKPWVPTLQHSATMLTLTTVEFGFLIFLAFRYRPRSLTQGRTAFLLVAAAALLLLEPINAWIQIIANGSTGIWPDVAGFGVVQIVSTATVRLQWTVLMYGLLWTVARVTGIRLLHSRQSFVAKPVRFTIAGLMLLTLATSVWAGGILLSQRLFMELAADNAAVQSARIWFPNLFLVRFGIELLLTATVIVSVLAAWGRRRRLMQWSLALLVIAIATAGRAFVQEWVSRSFGMNIPISWTFQLQTVIPQVVATLLACSVFRHFDLHVVRCRG